MAVFDWIKQNSIFMQAVSTLILLVVTSVYAAFTYAISKAARKQADASVKMAEEMREQTVMSSRPLIIQKGMPEIINGITQMYFSHFEVYNVGNGPAVELVIFLLNKEGNKIMKPPYRETYLRAGESPLWPNRSNPDAPFEIANLDVSDYCIVSEYQGIFSRASKKQKWYQTWLPFRTFRSSNNGKICVMPGELEFREVSEDDRIMLLWRSNQK